REVKSVRFEADISKVAKHAGFNVTGYFAGLDIHGRSIDFDPGPLNIYLPFVATPFQMSLRARLCPIWLFPRAGRPQVAMTTPANLCDDFDRPEILAAAFSLPESKNEDNKAFKTLFALRHFMHMLSRI
ncbi:hypothetical protein ALC62_04315, partial [Cyphomyrmex costatus]